MTRLSIIPASFPAYQHCLHGALDRQDTVLRGQCQLSCLHLKANYRPLGKARRNPDTEKEKV